MLRSLVDLAKESCSGKRRELMGHIASLFIEGADRHTDEELTLFNDILINLLDLIDINERREFSGRMAHVDTTPRPLILKLANDKADVAAPVLEHSCVLTDEDLFQLARTKGQDHLMAISRRGSLRPKITDVLLERGEKPVQHSVAANTGAELSDWGGRLLIKLAESDRELREALTERHDLSKPNFDRLLSMLPADRQAKLRYIFENNERMARNLFKEASALVDEGKLERRKSRLNAKATLKDLRDGHKQLDQAVIEYSLSNELYELAFLLGQFAQIDERFVRNIMVRPDVEAIAVLCRSVGVSDTAFGALCKARCRHMRCPSSQVDHWAGEYRILSEAEAQRTMRFIKVRLSVMAAAAA
ncbi:DUF2336 domain-containing protein [Pannonibacter phragmitetus]|uniref:DUF2336 domain-containing protein n=1 Tax=Pannonibacter phragmitetus TaxID=121719 RepID=UPI001AD904FF|nr:DUF2336 domain-containing protein [Pannonibacter phragmitetus]